MKNFLIGGAALALATFHIAGAQADVFSSLGLPANTYGDPASPSGNFASNVGLDVQTNCALPGTIGGAENPRTRQTTVDRTNAKNGAREAAIANGASPAEAAVAGAKAYGGI